MKPETAPTSTLSPAAEIRRTKRMVVTMRDIAHALIITSVLTLVVAGWSPTLAWAQTPTTEAPSEVNTPKNAAVVSVLPFTSTDARMRLYGKPLAKVIATELERRTQVRVVPVSLDAVPVHVRLVIDGRIVSHGVDGDQGVTLEARVRDPQRGATLVAVTSAMRPLSNIDQLAVELAKNLALRVKTHLATPLTPSQVSSEPGRPPAVAMTPPAQLPAPQTPDKDLTAKASQVDQSLPDLADRGDTRTARTQSKAAQPTPRQPTTSSPGDRPSGAPVAGRQPSPKTLAPPGTATHSIRPRMVVFRAYGSVANDNVPVVDIATEAGHRLASAAGARSVVAALELAPIARIQDVAIDSIRAGDIGTAIKAVSCDYGLLIEVRDIEFSWLGILTARAHIRVVVVGADGQRHYDQTQRTDTVIGSRGDRHHVLVRMVLSQAVDMFVPALRHVLRQSAGTSSRKDAGRDAPIPAGQRP